MRYLYVHIPFCKEKCNYCDFVSFQSSPEERLDYVRLLKQEAKLNSGLKDEGGLLTVFFGGGTPSLLPVREIEDLLSEFKADFGFADSMEITLEANPETVSKRYLKQLRRAGVNRISFGAQAFQNHHLRAMGRIHDVEDILRCVDDAADAGFENINIDLMYGLPSQTMEEWKKSLEAATLLPVTHISTYGLKLSPETRWGKWLENGKLTLPDDDTVADMQLYAMEYLDNNGFPRYEIANFARIGYPCRHNASYWLRKDYLGLGLNAASLKDGKLRYVNHDCIGEYAKALYNGKLPRKTVEELSESEIMEEEFFLPLRTIWGLDIAGFAKKYGPEFFAEREERMVPLFEAGYMTVEDGYLKLTDKGVLVSNSIFAQILA